MNKELKKNNEVNEEIQEQEYRVPKVYTVKEVATILMVGVDRVYKLINKGVLRVIKLGHIKIPATELDDFIERNMNKDLSDLDNIKDL